ncbi:MAG: type II toxin-antitoxin system Phd/YefM family antitoxin [Defluviitaleaceae bacterium]|nr:type II toxin-antitoxin system Phd/YefM family antitoxin [Defluviitaleaceae bacterium]
MLNASATEFKTNMGKYLTLVNRQDIYITKNGRAVAVLTAPKPQQNWADDLVGVIPDINFDEKKYKGERLANKYESLD